MESLDEYEWRAQECREYVNELEDNAVINFSELAKDSGVKGKDNKHQVVKQFLVES